LSRITESLKIKVFVITIFAFKIVLISAIANYQDFIIFNDSHNYILNLNAIITSGDYSMKNIQNIAGTLHVGHYYYMLIPYYILKTPLSIIYTNTLITSISIILLHKVFKKEFGNKIANFTF